MWFKKKDTVDDVLKKVDKVGAWIGNKKFTEEERAELSAENTKSLHKFVADTLDENTDRSKARREVAVFFIKFYAIMLFMCGMVYPISAEWSNVWFELATSLSVGGLISAISLFFFGSHVAHKLNLTGKK